MAREGEDRCRIGLPVPPLEAVEMAQKLQRPFDSAQITSDRLGRAISRILTAGQAKIQTGAEEDFVGG